MKKATPLYTDILFSVVVRPVNKDRAIDNIKNYGGKIKEVKHLTLIETENYSEVKIKFTCDVFKASTIGKVISEIEDKADSEGHRFSDNY